MTEDRAKYKVAKKYKQKVSEGNVKKACCDYLQVLENQKKLMFLRNNTLAVATKSGHYVKNGKVGSPDILVWKQSEKWAYEAHMGVDFLRSIAIETKAKGKGQSPDQLKWQADFEKLGGEYYVVECLEDLIKIIL